MTETERTAFIKEKLMTWGADVVGIASFDGLEETICDPHRSEYRLE